MGLEPHPLDLNLGAAFSTNLGFLICKGLLTN